MSVCASSVCESFHFNPCLHHSYADLPQDSASLKHCSNVPCVQVASLPRVHSSTGIAVEEAEAAPAEGSGVEGDEHRAVAAQSGAGVDEAGQGMVAATGAAQGSQAVPTAEEEIPTTAGEASAAEAGAQEMEGSSKPAPQVVVTYEGGSSGLLRLLQGLAAGLAAALQQTAPALV